MTSDGRTARRLAMAIGALLAVSAAPARAQEDCEFLPGTGNVRGVTIGQSRITYLGTPNLACANGVRIRADSAVVYESSAFTQLFGNVRFEDPDRRLRAAEAQYFNRVGRLQAQRNVELVRKADSSVIRGTDLVYVPGGGGRPDRLTVTGERATATLRVQPAARPSAAPVAEGPAVPAADTAPPRVEAPAAPGADTAAPPAEVPRAPAADTAVTYDVHAERIVLEGETGFVAVGRGRPVEIVRDSLRAFGDSVSYQEAAGLLALREDARLEGSGYDLAGDSIDVLLPDQEVREVVAQGGATLTGEDVRLTAPRIRLFLTDGALERLVAMAAPPAPAAQAEEPEEEPLPRPRATAETFDLVADSIEVLAPGEVLERLVAVGSAAGESTARDSLNTPETPPIARKDWIQGDTIVATFARVAAAAGAPRDTTATQLERLEARGTARSLYRLEPSDSARAAGADRLAVHYVTGDEIVIQMASGEVERMEVVGPARGLHLEPRRAPAPPPPDTAGVPPDTATVPIDTVPGALPRGRSAGPPSAAVPSPGGADRERPSGPALPEPRPGGRP